MGIRVDDAEQSVYLKIGRPSIPDLLRRVSEVCVADHIPEVAVMVCGPAAMVNEVVDCCPSTQLSTKKDQIRFFVHQEVFDF